MFDDIAFPIIKNISSKLLSGDIISMKPISLEESAFGREIKQYPIDENKYTLLDTYERLKKHVIAYILDNNIPIEWLTYNHGYLMPLIHDPDIYYNDNVGFLDISIEEPKENIMDNGWGLRNEIILKLDPRYWSRFDIKKLIEEIKEELSKNI
jgi:hypothetical protein